MERGPGFPQGPFELSTKFLVRRWLAVVLGGVGAIALLGLYGYMSWGQARGIWHDQRIWDAGGPEGPVEVGGEVTTRQFVLKSYRLEVVYVTPDGARHAHEAEVETLFGALAEDVEQRVRLSPTNPDDFALSTVVAASTPRYFAAAFFLIVGSLIAVAVALIARAALEQLRRVSAAARDGVLWLAPIVSRERVLANGGDTGAEKVVFRVPRPDGGEVDVDYQLRTKGSPLLTARGGAAVLALVPPSAPSRAVLLLESFYPLRLPAEPAERLRAALNSAR